MSSVYWSMKIWENISYDFYDIWKIGGNWFKFGFVSFWAKNLVLTVLLKFWLCRSVLIELVCKLVLYNWYMWSEYLWCCLWFIVSDALFMMLRRWLILICIKISSVVMTEYLVSWKCWQLFLFNKYVRWIKLSSTIQNVDVSCLVLFPYCIFPYLDVP